MKPKGKKLGKRKVLEPPFVAEDFGRIDLQIDRVRRVRVETPGTGLILHLYRRVPLAYARNDPGTKALMEYLLNEDPVSKPRRLKGMETPVRMMISCGWAEGMAVWMSWRRRVGATEPIWRAITKGAIGLEIVDPKGTGPLQVARRLYQAWLAQQ